MAFPKNMPKVKDSGCTRRLVGATMESYIMIYSASVWAVVLLHAIPKK